MGQAPPGDSYNENDVGIPMIAGAGDLGNVFPNPSKFTTKANKMCRKGDIILCIRATIGDKNWADKEYCLGRGVAALQPNKDVLSSKYLWHWIETAKQFLLTNSRGSTFKQVTKDVIQRWEISLPPIDEQKRIAAILDKADEIEKNSVKAYKTRDLVIQSTFYAMFGDPLDNQQKWKMVSLNKLGKVITGTTPPSSKEGMFGGDIPFVTPGDLETGLNIAKRYLTVEGKNNSRTVRKGATLCCCIGATIGKTGISLTESAFNQQINAIDWGSEIEDLFGYYCVKYISKSFLSKARNTAVPILKKSSFEKICIPVPPI